MVGADNLRGRAFAVDVPNVHNGKGRVFMFANNPVYRWQNHGEFNMVSSILNWNDVPVTAPQVAAPVAGWGGGLVGHRRASGAKPYRSRTSEPRRAIPTTERIVLPLRWLILGTIQ
jgi:hypothetical protein